MFTFQNALTLLTTISNEIQKLIRDLKTKQKFNLFDKQKLLFGS